ncbi:hypothetical protein AYI68_g6175 [Smittium mucronatum]|uniref:Uncharacterized protein n=1 Tax=Smittium mucronatum TaxID=133383 RepID=A0A1R0GS92_9FUNG|nr:hypothetical protein AYI68_g6175 [Smittium mucronatum]
MQRGPLRASRTSFPIDKISCLKVNILSLPISGSVHPPGSELKEHKLLEACYSFSGNIPIDVPSNIDSHEVFFNQDLFFSSSSLRSINLPDNSATDVACAFPVKLAKHLSGVFPALISFPSSRRRSRIIDFGTFKVISLLSMVITGCMIL